MELYIELLAKVLKNQQMNIVFPNLDINSNQIIEMECYNALKKIKAIIEDESLEDSECFMKIEEIVCLFEQLGSGGGNRHDFG